MSSLENALNAYLDDISDFKQDLSSNVLEQYGVSLGKTFPSYGDIIEGISSTNGELSVSITGSGSSKTITVLSPSVSSINLDSSDKLFGWICDACNCRDAKIIRFPGLVEKVFTINDLSDGRTIQ